MTITHLIHLSDMHFDASDRNTLPFKFIEDSLTSFITGLVGDKILILGGDITYQGSKRGYELAARFFESIVARTGLERSNIIVCPGNHDIMRHEKFEGIDGFTYALRKDKALEFRRAHCYVLRAHDIEFIINNSAYHENHQYGLADLDSVSECLTSPRPSSVARILVSHHHFMPLFENDTSATRNAYGLISLADSHQVRLALHGHQHFNMGFPMGHTPIHCFGVSSFNFDSSGILNGLNHYAIDAESITMDRQTLVLDGPAKHRSGFVRIGSALRIDIT